MSANIVDVDAFTDPIARPTDGDALNGASILPALQGYGNRTRNLLNRTALLELIAATWGVYEVGNGSSWGAGGTKAPISVVGSTGAISLAANEVTLTNAGLYAVALSLTLGSTLTSNPQVIPVSLQLAAATVASLYTQRFTASAGDITSASNFVIIGATAGQKLSVVSSQSGTYSATTTGVDGRVSLLTVVRIK